MKDWTKYLEKLSTEQKDIVQRILEMAMHLAPESSAEMPYGVPGLKLNGKPLLAVAAHKEHYGVYPFSPKVIKEAKVLIGDRKTAEGTIRFKYGDTPSEELIKRLIELRSKEIL
jgi:uncharacterized protein YdhG (YjbR/CyaY superfamily)